jgi:DNA polymerase-3 subunit gamma/tau
MMEKSKYIAIARKYRPQKFSEVIYQPHIVKILQNGLKTGNIHHSYIFSGMRGVGKTSVARIFAKALNCENPSEGEPCGKCSSCMEITEGRFPDVLEIDGASNRGIDQVRELRETIKYKPLKGKYKVIIIDEVHMLTNEAFNALLKTLEEPPPNTVFILATTEFHKVLPTVVSRSIALDFRRIPFVEIKKQLRNISDEEQIEVSDWALSRISEVSEGSLRDSLSILEQISLYDDKKIKDETLNNILGLIDEEVIGDIFSFILEKDKKKVFEATRKIYEAGEDFFIFYKQLFEYFRKFLYYKELNEVEETFSKNQTELFKKYKERLSGFTILRILNFLEKGEYSLKKSLNKRYLLDIMLLNLIYIQDALSIEELKTEGKKQNTAKPLKKNENLIKTPKTIKSSSFFEQIKEKIREKKEFVSFSLNDVVDFKEGDNTLEFRISSNRKTSLELLTKEKSLISDIVKELKNKNYNIVFSLETNHIKKTSEEELYDDENIKKFLDIFKGEIINIKKKEEK